MSVTYEAALLMSQQAWDSLPRRSRIAISSVLHPVLPGPDGCRLFVDDHLNWDMDRPDMEEVDRVVKGEVREFDEGAGELFDFVMVPEDDDPVTERTNMGPALDDMLGKALEKYAAPYYDLWMMREAGIIGPDAETPESRMDAEWRMTHDGDDPPDYVPDEDELDDDELSHGEIVYADPFFPDESAYLRVKCPHCGKETAVFADIGPCPWVAKLRVPVLAPDPCTDDPPDLGWGDAEIEADVFYVCEHCDRQVGRTLEDLRKMTKEQHDAQGDGPQAP